MSSISASAARVAQGEWTAVAYRMLARPDDLTSFRILVEQSDLLVCALRPLEMQARTLVWDARRQITDYMDSHPQFVAALAPQPPDAAAAPVVSAMLRASRQAGVGPMAAVAGAIAEYVGRGLLVQSEEVIVENGGDVFLCSRRRREVALLAEHTALGGLRIALPPAPDGLGFATSAGTIGHSLSFGTADAVMVLADSAALADALATAVGNRIREPDDLAPALATAQVLGARGVVALAAGHVAAWGAIELLD